MKKELGAAKAKLSLFYTLAMLYIIVTHTAFVLLLVFTTKTVSLTLCIPFLITSLVSELIAKSNRNGIAMAQQVNKKVLITIYILISVITLITYTLLTIFVNQGAWILMLAVCWIHTMFLYAFTKDRSRG